MICSVYTDLRKSNGSLHDNRTYFADCDTFTVQNTDWRIKIFDYLWMSIFVNEKQKNLYHYEY